MRYHGLDLHKGSAAVSIRDEAGHEVRYIAKVETGSYVATLGPQDSVALESGCGSFLWAERIQCRRARCIVIDPYRFRIIRDSWHKTDRHDAGALSLGLWTSAQSGELVLPEVWQPTPEVRELRRLFSHWQMLNNQSRQLKAQVQSVLVRALVVDDVAFHRLSLTANPFLVRIQPGADLGRLRLEVLYGPFFLLLLARLRCGGISGTVAFD